MITVLKQRIGKKFFAKLLRSDDVADTYYFGYGANIDPDFFKKRINHFELIGIGELEYYQFKINVPCEYQLKGYGGIVPSKDHSTFGTVYKISKSALRLLDILEWVPFRFYTREFLEVRTSSATINAVVYVPCHPRESLKAPEGYKKLLLEGAKKMKLPDSYIEYISSLPTGADFKIDHTFNLSNPGKKRLFVPYFSVLHDRFREWVCSKI